MKKFGLLITLILCVIVGGVYATWTYAQAPVDTKVETISPEVVVKDVSSAKGAISVENNTLAIKIDDTDGNYEADLVITGSMDIKFTPDTAADTATKAGIKLQFKVTGPTGCQYNLTDVFNVTTTETPLAGGSPTLKTTLDAATLQSLITLNPVTLDTPQKHTDFSNAVAGKTFTITISEAPASN